jgi:glycosyltransferase involved in cell wall biosynthesis
MPKKNLKINFILPFKSLNGGVKVVLEYANQLTELGHKVTVTYPLFPYFFGEKKISLKDRWWQLRGLIANLVRGNKVKWFDLKANLKRVPWISEHFVPDCDIVVATAWRTAYSVAKLSKIKGKKIYFIQGYEVWNGSREKVHNSYQLPLTKIIVSNKLKQRIEQIVGQENIYVVSNGINWKKFYNEKKEFNNPPKILLMNHRLKFKGTKDAINAISQVRQKYPNIKVTMFGTSKARGFPDYIEYHFKPIGEMLRQIYSTSDIFVFASWSEGFGLPPMEAMACKCAVVASNVGGIPDYTIPGKTALIFEPQDIRAMANHIIYLLENPDELKRISFAGYEQIKSFTWDRAARKMVHIFLKALVEQA